MNKINSPSVAESAAELTSGKGLDDNFRDWEGSVFGFGYGTGEPYTLSALQQFFRLLSEGRSYNHQVLEAAMTPTVAWLIINMLCRADILEYGTSPRYGWLTAKGERLRDYLAGKTTDDLVETVCNIDPEEYVPCYPDVCNCGPTGYVKGRVCYNPFWSK